MQPPPLEGIEDMHRADPCLVLTSDPKPRLRWTADLHDRFVDAVTQLGGAASLFLFPQSISCLSESSNSTSTLGLLDPFHSSAPSSFVLPFWSSYSFSAYFEFELL